MSLKTIKVPPREGPELYDGAVLIDDSWANWSPDEEVTRMYLQGVINHACQIKQVRGHLFLNEFYDQLSLPRTYWGQISGWLNTEVDVRIKPTSNSKFWLEFVVENNIHEESFDS